jgi:hypothetical protein
MGGVPVLFLPFLRRGQLFFLHLLLQLHNVIFFFEGPFFGVCAKRMCEYVCDWEGYVLCRSILWEKVEFFSPFNRSYRTLRSPIAFGFPS